jgi:hypothetical protein
MSFQIATKENKFWVELLIYTMSQYLYPKHFCRTLKDLDNYLSIDKRELKNIDAKFQEKIGYWAFYNHLQDYKIYGTMIKMFCLEFLNNLWQHPKENPWPIHSINENYKTWFYRQCDYLLRFQAKRKISESLLLQNWLKMLLTLKMMNTKH